MIVDQSIKKCAHEPCACGVEPDKTYCSDYCETAASSRSVHEEIEHCNCGHPACAGSARAEQQKRSAEAA